MASIGDTNLVFGFALFKYFLDFYNYAAQYYNWNPFFDFCFIRFLVKDSFEKTHCQRSNIWKYYWFINWTFFMCDHHAVIG